MASRGGSLLEKQVAKILTLSGFKPKLNQIIQGYEIDVLAKINGKKIAFECKQYEKSNLGLRNLIHQWDSKNKELGFDRIVLALVGCNISDKDKELAKKYGIILWDDGKIEYLLDKSIEEKTGNGSCILKELKIEKTKEGSNAYPIGTPTSQQRLMKEKLDELLKNGKKEMGWVIFEIKKRFDPFSFGSKKLPYIQYCLEERGLQIFYRAEYPHDKVISLDHVVAVKNLLESLGFKQTINLDKVECLNSNDLDEKEIAFNDGYNKKELYANCGEDTTFVAWLSEKILKEIFGAEKDFDIEINIELNG